MSSPGKKHRVLNAFFMLFVILVTLWLVVRLSGFAHPCVKGAEASLCFWISDFCGDDRTDG